MKYLLFLTILIMGLVLFGCDDSGGGETCQNDEACNQTKENIVIEYGSATCSACTSLDQDLTINHIDHIFYDVNEDMDKNQEMADKFFAVYPNDQLSIPIVDVNGTILKQPTVLQIKKYLWENLDPEE